MKGLSVAVGREGLLAQLSAAARKGLVKADRRESVSGAAVSREGYVGKGLVTARLTAKKG